jgi:hypothetical protein
MSSAGLFGVFKNAVLPNRRGSELPVAGMAVSKGQRQPASAIWEINASAQGKFRVELPGKVRPEVVVLPDRPVLASLTIRNSGFFYCAACSDYSALPGHGHAIAAMADGRLALSQDDFKMLAEKQVDLAGYPGRQYEISYRSGMISLRRIAAVEERFYRLDIGFMPEDERDAEANCERFFNSFTLL